VSMIIVNISPDQMCCYLPGASGLTCVIGLIDHDLVSLDFNHGIRIFHTKQKAKSMIFQADQAAAIQQVNIPLATAQRSAPAMPFRPD
jgi:hypothetical protein